MNSSFWLKLLGDADSIGQDHRAFNAVVFTGFCIMLSSLPINWYLGFENIVWAAIPIIIWLGFVFYLSRVRNVFKISKNIFGFLSYVMVVVVFVNSSGIAGPALSFSFLTFLLLLSFSSYKKQIFWLVCHVFFVLAMLLFEYHFPEKVPYKYQNEADRYFDYAASAITILLSMFFITRYLRSGYFKAMRIAEERAELIADQNRELLRLNLEKNKLFSIISHDLRSPLHSITSVLNLLANYPLSEEQRLKLKKDLLESAQNTTEMLSNLLSWSTDQLKGINPTCKSVCVKDVLAKVSPMQRIMARSKNIQISETVSEQHKVWADEDMLELILRNLINNAVKFTNPEGQITITSTRDNRQCIISVADTGIGMSQEQIADLFGFRAQSTYGTNNEKGIGLGLMMCKDFSKMQDGELRVESELGKGTIFRLLLPLANDNLI